ncbi:hypothetical protein Mapa_008055 [Marchantia paleacea]|nr:hypothetical protein Mapa_008055 [Marchantia paleacea]
MKFEVEKERRDDREIRLKTFTSTIDVWFKVHVKYRPWVHSPQKMETVLLSICTLSEN